MKNASTARNSRPYAVPRIMNVGHELEIASCCGVNPVPSDVSEDLRVIVRWASGGHAEYRGFQMNGCQIG